MFRLSIDFLSPEGKPSTNRLRLGPVAEGGHIERIGAVKPEHAQGVEVGVVAQRESPEPFCSCRIGCCSLPS